MSIYRLYSLLSMTLLLGCSPEKDPSHTGGHTDDTADEVWDVSTSLESEGGTFWIAYSTNPDPIAQSEAFSATFVVHDAQNHDEVFMDAEVLSVDAAMPSHEHGMNVAPEITDNGNGTFTASPLEFMMGGHWELYAEVNRGGLSEQATFHVICCGD